jgi:hypothetical protein
MSNAVEWLKVALENQKDNIIHGYSKKFPCETEEEKRISLIAIDGFMKLLEEYQRSYYE